MRFEPLKMVTFVSVLAAVASAGSAQDAAPAKALTSAEMLEQAQGVVKRGVSMSQTVGTLVAEATADTDIMLVTCLNAALTAIDGHTASAQDHLLALQGATDAEVRAHQHRMIMVVGQQLDTAGQEAGQCVGQDLFGTGTTTTQMITNNNLLPVDESPSVLPTVLPPSLPTVPRASSGKQ